MLRAHDLFFRYDDGAGVLSGFSADFAAGEVTYICGPSGSGKTTLSLLLAEMMEPQSGEILLTPDEAPRATMVLQFAEELFLTDSVRQEIELLTDTKRIEAAHQHLKSCGLCLPEIAERDPFTLSFGQARLLAISIQCAQDTPVYILDEPTIGLDEVNMLRVSVLLRALTARGKGVIVVTHDPELIESLPGRVMILEQGTLAWHGPSAEFLATSSLRSRAAFE
jgi:energy-coupling factor transporter ATP-binding protein EcfA2